MMGVFEIDQDSQVNTLQSLVFRFVTGVCIKWMFCNKVDSVNKLRNKWSSNFPVGMNLFRKMTTELGPTDGRCTCHKMFFPHLLLGDQAEHQAA